MYFLSRKRITSWRVKLMQQHPMLPFYLNQTVSEYLSDKACLQKNLINKKLNLQILMRIVRFTRVHSNAHRKEKTQIVYKLPQCLTLYISVFF